MRKKANNLSRRSFVSLSATGMAAIPLLSFENVISKSYINNNKGLIVNVFSKHLQFLDYLDMSEAAVEMGFDGIDLTIRPGGHVLPERVTEDLPKAIEAMKYFGLLPLMITTNITSAHDPISIKVLETASQENLKYYRMGWLDYPEDKTINQSIKAFSDQFNALEKLNKKLSLHGSYQNHEGTHMGSPVWDLAQVLEDSSPQWVGSQYDIRHATVEGGNSWELGLRLIHPYINTIVIKDFKWGLQNGKWMVINTPLGEGMVNFKRYFSLLKKYNVDVPVSLHFEYGMGGAEHGKGALSIDKKQVFRQMKKDLNFLRETWVKVK